MKQLSGSIFILFAGYLGIVLASAESFDKQIKIFDNPELERLVLIGFEDSSINRFARATAIDPYRRRGEYKGSTWSKRVISQISQDYSLEMLSEWPMTEIGIHCVVFKIPASGSVEQVLNALHKDKRIRVAQKMHAFKVQASHYKDPYFSWQTNLRDMRIAEVHARTTGRNIFIALIDTGVDTAHPDLQGQVVSTENFAEAVSDSFSTDAHGTAVAGVISARPNNTGIVGIAPGARLVALKACWPVRVGEMEAVCNSFTLALAVNAAIRAKVDILNMSLTGPIDPILTMLLDKAAENGIIIIAADAGSNSDKISFPASLDSVIAVRNTDAKNAIQATRLRSIAAPGSDILTTLPHGKYDYVSGSSLAAAQVSGIVALMLQLDPEISKQNILANLQANPSLDLCKMLLCGKQTAIAETETLPL